MPSSRPDSFDAKLVSAIDDNFLSEMTACFTRQPTLTVITRK